MVEGKILTLLPAVVGPTASGKTALSLALGRRLGCEIVCCDSMQIYRGMDIGTAKPDAAERAVLPHHMLDIIPKDHLTIGIKFWSHNVDRFVGIHG